MIITRVETHFFHPGQAKNLLFVRIETDQGLYGWGESYVSAKKEKVVGAYVDSLAEVLVGRSALNIRHLGQVLLDDFAIRRVSVDFLCAWSAIEIALWDILGKHAGLPVHQLLGGAVRGSVRVYANGWWFGAKDLDDVLRRAVDVTRQGYDAIKWDPIPGPWRTFISKQDEDQAVFNLKALRDAVGPDVDILIDGHRRLAPAHAIRLAARFEDIGIGWYEEPCPPENLALTAEVRRNIKAPIVIGEALYTKEQFLPVFQNGAADILNPDTCAVGGISAMLDIAALAQPHAVAISPHNFNSTLVGLAATAHVSALIPNFTIAEVFVNLVDACEDIALDSIRPEAGWLSLPTGPGLGVDIDIAALKRHPYRDTPAKPLRHHGDEFPRRPGLHSVKSLSVPASS